MSSKGDNQEQQSMFKVLTEGRKIGKPLLLYIVDSYTRARIEYYKQSKNKNSNVNDNVNQSENDNDKDHDNEEDDDGILSINKWLKTNKQLIAITNNNQQNMELLQGAIQTFYARINSAIKFQPREKIQDEIEPFAKYIQDALKLIKTVLKGGGQGSDSDPDNIDRAIPPFQVKHKIKSILPVFILHCTCFCFLFFVFKKVDLWIIPNDTYDMDQEEDDDDSDDEDDDDEESKGGDSYDIEASLSGIPHHQYQFREGRRWYEDWKKLKNNPALKGYKEYPHNRRFCIIADRRNKPKTFSVQLEPVKKKLRQMADYSRNDDQIYIYHPPKGNEIPNDHLSEKFMQLSNECLLPKSTKCDAVNAKTASSKLFLLSFHVEAADEIRCYLYQRGQISRFYPKVCMLCIIVRNYEYEYFVCFKFVFMCVWFYSVSGSVWFVYYT